MKIRQPDFTTVTRQRKVTPPTSGTDQVHAVACSLLREWLESNPAAKVRLLGVGGSNLSTADQGDLFDDIDAESGVDKTVDEIRSRFGSDALGRARTLGKR